MFDIIELNKDNFKDFLALLQQRGEAPEDFYSYKYLQQTHTFFPTGFIAYINTEAVGCIGNINKIYIDDEGNEHQATWFADWFVSDTARGKGIGKALMKKVFNLSPYAFGVPGPEKAQIVAKKTGYKKQNNFYEILVPCQPFYYGFKKNKSNIIRNLLRGVKHLFSNKSITKNSDVNVEEINKTYIFEFKKKKNSFKIDGKSLHWLISIPEKEGNLKKWYKVKYKNNWLILFTENDSNQNNRARIIHVSVEDKEDYLSVMEAIRYKLASMNILYFQTYYYSLEKPSIANEYIKPIPQSCSFEVVNDFTISIADFESRWRDFVYL